MLVRTGATSLVTVASRSMLVGALLRNVVASQRNSLLNFLRGLSKDELQCLAEFEGACILEVDGTKVANMYRLLADFFDSKPSERCYTPDERAHKTFVVFEYLNILHGRKVRIPVNL